MDDKEPTHRCEGCGEWLHAHEVDEEGGHTASVHDCDGTPESCWKRCPVPVHCGPAHPTTGGTDDG